MSKKLLSVLIGIVTGICNGFFGAGGGTVLVPASERLLKTEEHKAHATAIAVILPLCIISACLYSRTVAVSVSTIIYVSVGGIVGGYVGARLLGKIPRRWLHIIFGGFMIAAGAKMIC